MTTAGHSCLTSVGAKDERKAQDRPHSRLYRLIVDFDALGLSPIFSPLYGVQGVVPLPPCDDQQAIGPAVYFGPKPPLQVIPQS